MRAYVLFITFSLLGCAFPATSQQPLVGSIQGTVTNQQEAPIPYADLTATNIDNVEPESGRQTTGADKQGIYQFVEVPPGRYSIVVRKSGYRDYTVTLVTVYPGETVNMPEIKMSPVAAH
jgi:hypothetical protein